MCRFTGEETRDEVFAQAKEFFEDVQVSAMKLGLLSGPETERFVDRSGKECKMKQYMVENRLKPSVTNLYLIVEGQTPSRGTQQGDQHSHNSSSSSEDEQPTQEHLDSVTKIPPRHITKTGRELGRGSQAVVFEGTWSNVQVALKESVVPTEADATYIHECICQEVALHFRLRHPNVLTLYGICRENTTITLVTELMDKSLGHIMDEQVSMTNREKAYIGQQCADGLAFLHSVNIVHGDIKPVNILLDATRRTVKLCDMGLSRVKEDLNATRTTSMRGTVPFMSPCMLVRKHRSTFTCDVWALGGTLTELFGHNDLWEVPTRRGASLMKVMIRKMRSEVEPDGLAKLRDVDARLYDVVAPCLSYDLATRPTAQDLADHLQQLVQLLIQEEGAAGSESA